MVITVTCPSCSSSFPVDTAKVPPQGVNARCSSCGDIFRIEKPAESEAEPTVRIEEPVAAEAPAAGPRPSASLDDVEVVPPPPLAKEAAPAASAAPAEPAVSAFKFGKRDPTDKAKRLARVLVSDMIMYNADRHQTALEGGTLKADFEDEIEKSWKEFVEQVGADIAEGDGREFWREALNDILAKGEQVF